MADFEISRHEGYGLVRTLRLRIADHLWEVREGETPRVTILSNSIAPENKGDCSDGHNPKGHNA